MASPSVAELNENQSWKVIVSTSVGFTITITALALRLTSRWLCRKRLEWNDYFIILAFFPKLGLDIASILLIEYGLGRHIETVNPDDVTKYLQVEYVGSFLYAPTCAFIKLSILSLFWSAFPSKFMRRSVMVIGGIVTAWGIALCLVGLLACLPIHKFWDPTIPGTCINQQQYYWGLQIPNIVTDVAILILPFKPIWELNLPLRQKILMSIVFCLGVLTCIFDIIRLVVLLNLPTTIDVTWNETMASVWTDLEPSVAYLVACLIVSKPIFCPKESWRRRKSKESEDRSMYDADSDSKGSKYGQHVVGIYDDNTLKLSKEDDS